MTKRWYVVATEPNTDVRFARDLGKRGYEAYIAITFVRKHTGNRSRAEPRRRFPGYVWVAIDDARKEVGTDREQNFDTIKQTYGYLDAISLRITTAGDRSPSEVPEGVIRGLQRDFVEDYDIATRRIRYAKSERIEHQVGQFVTVAPDHPLFPFRGPIEQIRSNGVVALFGAMKMPVRLDWAEIVPVKPFENSEKNREDAETSQA